MSSCLYPGYSIHQNNLQSPVSLSTLSDSTMSNSNTNNSSQSPPSSQNNANNLTQVTQADSNNNQNVATVQNEGSSSTVDGVDDSDLADPVAKEVQELFKKEKSYVKFRDPPKKHFKNLNSYWGKVDHLDFTHLVKQRQKIPSQELVPYEGLIRCFDMIRQASREDQEAPKSTWGSICKRLVVCPICFKDPNASFLQSTLLCGKDPKGVSSNVGQHRRDFHPKLVEKEEEEGIQHPTNVESSQSLMTSYKGATMLSKEEARSKFKEAIYRFVNDNGLPTSTVEKESFRQLLQFAILQGPKLSKNDAVMSNKAITKMRLTSYNSFMRTIAMLGRNIRNAYKALCGKAIPFGTICHDIWQGHRKDILGICIFLVDPRNCAMYRIPLGLCEVAGHSAAAVAKHTLDILGSVGFTQRDLSSSVNDNTNAAVLAGKYIVGNQTGGKCDMHRAELILKHGTGIAVRRRGGSIQDEFPDFVKVYKAALKLVALVMNKRTKKFEEIRQYAAKHNMVAIELPIPNSTRVNGCVIMFHGLLRMKFVFDSYYAKESPDNEFKRGYLTKQQWQAIAEFEAILAPLRHCAMTLQSDDPSSSAGSLLEIFGCKHGIECHKKEGVRVLTVNPSDDNLDFQRWDAKPTIEKLKGKRNKIQYANLLASSKVLINRLLREFRTYMMAGDDVHAENAICGHPFLCAMAPSVLQSISIYNANDVERLKKNFVTDMVTKFYVPKRSGQPTTQSNVARAVAEGESHPESESDSDDDSVVGMFSIFKKHNQTQELAATVLQTYQAGQNPTPAPATPVTDKDNLYTECEKEFNSYKDFCNRMIAKNWEKLIREYPTPLFSEEEPKWTPAEKKKFVKACNSTEFNRVSKYFDVLKWWSVNKGNFSKVFPSAIIWLSKPSTNAFQERIFSSSSWFDSNRLMRRQSKKHFEVRTMELVTRKVREEIKKNEELLEGNQWNPITVDDNENEQEEEPASVPTDQQTSAAAGAVDNVARTNNQQTNNAIAIAPIEEGTADDDEVAVVEDDRDLTDGTFKGDMKRLEKLLKGVETMDKHHESGTEGLEGVIGCEYKFKSSDTDMDKEETYDEVELLDLVDKNDVDQMSVMGRLKRDDDPFACDDDSCIIEEIEEQQFFFKATMNVTDSSLPGASGQVTTMSTTASKGSNSGQDTGNQSVKTPVTKSSKRKAIGSGTRSASSKSSKRMRQQSIGTITTSSGRKTKVSSKKAPPEHRMQQEQQQERRVSPRKKDK